MDNRLKEILENFDDIKIGTDDPFKFHCTKCGKCCINREDILLTPRDLYNVAAQLKMTPEEVVNQYCDFYIGSDSRLPIVRLKPLGSVKRCPFLKDRKCSIHQAKPAVCAMFPIGRCVRTTNIPGEKVCANDLTVEYIFNKPGCGDDSEIHTVREWLGSFGIPLDDYFFRRWNSLIMKLVEFVRTLEKSFSPDGMNMVWSSIYVTFYLGYDMARPFLPQFEENADKYLELVEAVTGHKEN